MEKTIKEFKLLHNPPEIYREMLKDINSAKKYIYLETYIYDDDKLGEKFRDALIKKAKQGIRIKLLLDAWGSGANEEFFSELVNYGAELRFFREIRYVIRIFSKNHERNHRKLLLIDDKICYIGSANITERCLNWRELVLKIRGSITVLFLKSFIKSWNSYGELNPKRLKLIVYKGFEIIEDIPSYVHRLTEKKYVKLIKMARKTIMIETPYFVPSPGVRNALSEAVERGVRAIIIIPYRSDVKIVNTIRDRYLGKLHKSGVEIYYYKPKILHSKLLVVDNKFFLLGSSNIDYRSFIYQYELNFLGADLKMIKSMTEYFNKTLLDSVPFNYNEWKKRSSLKKILELLILFIREFL